MHKKKIVHSKLSFENIILIKKDKDDLKIKISDFGFSTYFDEMME